MNEMRTGSSSKKVLDLGEGLPTTSINPGVQVRFSNLTRNQNLTSDQIDEKLVKKAHEQSEASSLNDLIKNLVKEFAYKEAGLTLQEFLDKFDENNLADIIVKSFRDKIAQLDNEPSHLVKFAKFNRSVSDEDIKKGKMEVLRNITAYLENENLSGAVTLFEFLKNLQTRFPYLQFGELFYIPLRTAKDKTEETPTLMERIIAKINVNKTRVATEAYREKFDEDKKGFVMHYMVGRVIKLGKTGKEMVFDGKKFKDLMAYLDSLGVDIENVNGGTLYEWLAEESEEMAKHVEAERVNIVQRGIREELGKLPLDLPPESQKHDAKLIFEKGFNVEAFYKKHITWAILKYNSKKFRKPHSNPEVQLFHGSNSAERMSQVIFSTAHAAYLRRLVRTAQEDVKTKNQNFMATIRVLFGFNDSPLLKSLSNAEVTEILANYMDLAEKKLNKNVDDAMFYARQSGDAKDREAVEACKYYPEITGCRDLAKLMEWLVYKGSFKRDYPQYADASDSIIYHQCLMMLKDFAFISKRVNSEAFMSVGRRRQQLEEYQKKALGIRNPRPVNMRYRLMQEIIVKDGKEIPGPFKVIYDNKGLAGFDGGLDTGLAKALMADENITSIEESGKKYIVFPVEEAKFKKVEMNLKMLVADPVTDLMVKKSHKMEVLIYAGGNQYIHVKDELSRLLSETRGKEVTDENRWLIVPANRDDSDKLKTFLLMDHARDTLKLDDPRGGVSFSNKKNGAVGRTDSSKGLKSNQEWSIAKRHWLPDKDDDSIQGKLEPKNLVRRDAILETQAQTLADLLIYNISNHSPSSHTRYRSERALALMKVYFNPQIWGDKYREYFKRGYKAGKKL